MIIAQGVRACESFETFAPLRDMGNTAPDKMNNRQVQPPSQSTLDSVRQCQHGRSFTSAERSAGGLGLRFTVREDGSVHAHWTSPEHLQSYPGIIHGGILASLMDCAMVQNLFARGVTAKTGELTVRYRSSAKIDEPLDITGRMVDAHPPLFHMAAEIRQGERVCASAKAKFMALDMTKPD